MSGVRRRVVLDTNQIVGAGSRWLRESFPTPDPDPATNPHRRLVICILAAVVALSGRKDANLHLTERFTRVSPDILQGVRRGGHGQTAGIRRTATSSPRGRRGPSRGPGP